VIRFVAPRLVNEQRAQRRALSAALVAMAHIVMIYILLHPAVRSKVTGHRDLETILYFPRVPTVPPHIKPETSRAQSLPNNRPTFQAFPIPIPSSAAPDLSAFGQSLFGCAPEALANLSPDQRARCRAIVAPRGNSDVPNPRSDVKDPNHWAAAKVQNDTPLRIPCTYLETLRLSAATQATVGMVDPLCAIAQFRK
jgi:hypothetical protein